MAAIARRLSPSSRADQEHDVGEVGRGGDRAALVAELEVFALAAAIARRWSPSSVAAARSTSAALEVLALGRTPASSAAAAAV